MNLKPVKVEEHWSASFEEVPMIIEGNFNCRNNNYSSLKGAPIEVHGCFDCSFNILTTLEDAPIKTENFNASNNKLTQLNCEMEIIKGNFYLENNYELTKLNAKIKLITGDVWLTNCNKITLDEIKNFMKMCKVIGKVYGPTRNVVV